MLIEILLSSTSFFKHLEVLSLGNPISLLNHTTDLIFIFLVFKSAVLFKTSLIPFCNSEEYSFIAKSLLTTTLTSTIKFLSGSKNVLLDIDSVP